MYRLNGSINVTDFIVFFTADEISDEKKNTEVGENFYWCE